MKNTKQRNIILNIVNNSNNHLDAYEIYNLAKCELPNISLGTVYRNLSNLDECGYIQSLMVDGVKHYDKVFPHYHFVCNKCKNIIDVFDLNFPNINQYHNNIVTDCQMVLKGICERCQKEDNYGIKRK